MGLLAGRLVVELIEVGDCNEAAGVGAVRDVERMNAIPRRDPIGTRERWLTPGNAASDRRTDGIRNTCETPGRRPMPCARGLSNALIPITEPFLSPDRPPSQAALAVRQPSSIDARRPLPIPRGGKELTSGSALRAVWLRQAPLRQVRGRASSQQRRNAAHS